MEEKKLTTKQIFDESMILSEQAYKEKGEALVKYQNWLNQKWVVVD